MTSASRAAASTGGFDAIVGNPPFLGGKRISTRFGDDYRDWLAEVHASSTSNADLVAHFFRRAFTRLRATGAFGLIATNSIAQGETRNSGLLWICKHGGVIYDATRRHEWQGEAAVVVSLVHARREPLGPVLARIDGTGTARVSAFLFHAGGDDDPAPLPANEGKSFIGSYILGMGFTFDDTTPDATPLEEMHRLVANDHRNAERVFPYLGGEEVNSSPTHAHHRYVIDFGEMSADEAGTWPALFEILRTKVLPDRKTKDAKKYPRMVHEWWKFWMPRKELRSAVAGMPRVLVTARVSTHASFAFVPTRAVFSDQLVVFAFDSNAAFAVLSSRVHELWARFFCSSLGDALRYTPTAAFETFPFPEHWETNAALDVAGVAYNTFRAALMLESGEGLTATYNRFHDPDERDPRVAELRALHDAVDRAVLDAFGFSDVAAVPEFLAVVEETEDDTAPRKRRITWRYRWKDDVRDEVLARLLALNAQATPVVLEVLSDD